MHQQFNVPLIKQRCTNYESVNDNGVLTSFSRQLPAQHCCQPAGFEGDPASHYCHLQTQKTIEMSNQTHCTTTMHTSMMIDSLWSLEARRKEKEIPAGKMSASVKRRLNGSERTF
jgi:hypothetical protein